MADALIAAEVSQLDPEMYMLKRNLDDGYNYQFRKYEDWRENYDLYRDKVIVNRLTQRQTVNIPLMKQTVRTLLKDVDDMPILYFENLDNDKQAEVFKNAYWEWTVEKNKMDLQDIVGKRQVFLFGRTFTQGQIVDGYVKFTEQDPVDILVSRYCDPFNIHSSRYLIHTNIFVPLSSLKNNKDYDQDIVDELEMFYGTQAGLIKAAENEKILIQKQQKLADLGVLDAYSPVLGETYVALTLHFVYRDNEPMYDAQGDYILNEAGDKATHEPQIFMYVVAEMNYHLLKGKRKPLEEIIGVTEDHYWRDHYPYVTWADDVERQDFWSDGIGDVVRGANKILNVWFSQLIENRTLRSFGMNYYDATIEGFQPQTMQPMPFGWYGMPGDPNKVFEKVDIPDLKDSLDEMNFILSVNEKATGATATEQGAQTESSVTLGEIQIMLSQAQQRIKGMSKFYTPAWKENGMMFIKLCEAAPDKLDAVRIYKKGKNTSNVYSREISPKDWQTQLGYNVKVWTQDEKDSNDQNQLQKINAVKTYMPDNPVVNEEWQKSLLQFSGMTPDKIIAAMQYEEKKQQMMQSGQANPMMGGQPLQPGAPGALPPGAQQPLQLPAGGGGQPQPPQAAPIQ